MVGGRLLAGLLICVALLSGCSSLIHGKPVASGGAGPTEPSFPKAKPSIPSRAPVRPAPAGGAALGGAGCTGARDGIDGLAFGKDGSVGPAPPEATGLP